MQREKNSKNKKVPAEKADTAYTTETAKPQVIHGGSHSDERGSIAFINDFDLAPVKRMYRIQHPDAAVVRAWQGHLIEHKYFTCTAGSFIVAWKELDAHAAPVNDEKAEYTILKADEPAVLYIPSGYANGLKALENNSEIIVFSTEYLEDSLEDKIRFDSNRWFDWSVW